MVCDEVLSAIDPYLDGELSVMDVIRVHRHLVRCQRCRKVLNAERSLHALLSAATPEEEIGQLRERVLRRISAEDDSVHDVRRRRRTVGMLSAVFGGLVLVGILGALLMMSVGTGRPPLAPFAAELAAKHVLYSAGSRDLLELRTSDTNRMVAWLESRLQSSPRLPLLARASDQLVGGRISSVEDSPAAYILYDMGGRKVSLFVTKLLPGIRAGAKEQHVDGVELYAVALSGVAVAWWEDEKAGRVYAAVSTDGVRPVLDFVLLCAKRESTTWLRPSAPFAGLLSSAGNFMTSLAPDGHRRDGASPVFGRSSTSVLRA